MRPPARACVQRRLLLGHDVDRVALPGAGPVEHADHEDAGLVQQVQGHGEGEGGPDHVAGGDDGAHDEDGDEGVAAVVAEGLGGEDAERAEGDDGHGEFEAGAEGEHEGEDEVEVVVDAEHGVQPAAAEADEPGEGEGEHDPEGEGGAGEEEEHAGDEDAHHDAFLALVEGRGKEGPGLVEDDGEGEHDAEGDAAVEGDVEGVGGMGVDELVAAEVGGGGPHEQGHEVELGDDDEPDDGADGKGADGPDEAPAKFLEVVEEGHFAVGDVPAAEAHAFFRQLRGLDTLGYAVPENWIQDDGVSSEAMEENHSNRGDLVHAVVQPYNSLAESYRPAHSGTLITRLVRAFDGRDNHDKRNAANTLLGNSRRRRHSGWQSPSPAQCCACVWLIAIFDR